MKESLGMANGAGGGGGRGGGCPLCSDPESGS